MNAQLIEKFFASLRNKKVMGFFGALVAFIIILYLIAWADMKPSLLVETGLIAMTPLALAAVG